MAPEPEQESADTSKQKPTWKQRLQQRLIVVLEPARSWATAHRRLSIVIGGLFVLTLGTASIWFAVIYIRKATAEVITLEIAYEALDLGAYVEARRLATHLRSQGEILPDELGGPAFVLGAATLLEADQKWGKSKSSSYLIAARYLEEASDRGFPAERRATGLYMLGKSLYLSDQFATSRLYLIDALEANPNRKTEIHKLIASASRNDANPRLSEALDHITKYMSDPILSSDQRAEGMLEKSQILYDLGRIEECRKTLDEILTKTKNRAGVIAMQGRLLLDEARALRNDPELVDSGQNIRQARGKYFEAIKMFREAQGHDTLESTVTPTSMYLIGIALLEMGNKQAAHEQLSLTRKLYKETHEGLAAGLLEADILRNANQHEGAIAAYRRALTDAGRPRNYSNRWVSLNSFRERILSAYQHYLKIDQFELALKMLSKFPPMISRMRTIELQAETYRAWANSLLATAKELSDAQALTVEREARKHLRSAGKIYAKLAKKRTATRHYPNDLWNSADNLVLGQDYSGATMVLEEYLKNESRARRARALVNLGIASLAMGDVDNSLKALTECINFHPRDAAIYEARVWGAKAYVEKGEIENAEKLLMDNLTEDKLTPSSREWRESLFALGYLLHSSGRDKEAIKKLEEAVARYPQSSQVYKGMYTIAEAYRAAARAPQIKLEEATIESVRLELNKQIRQYLAGALIHYTLLQKGLNSRLEEVGLTTLEKAMLRNCYMAEGSVLSDLGRYEDPRHYEQAIRAYSNVSTRYQSKPIVLEAFVQIAFCYRRINKPVEARGALEQAKVVLVRLPPDVSFTSTTNYERDQWAQLLNQLSVW